MSKSIRVLHIVPHMQIGGINRFVLDLIQCQKEYSDLDIGIYICNQDNSQWKYKCDELGIKTYLDNITGKDVNPFHYKKFIKVKKQYDIIHWHVFAPLLAMMCLGDDKIHIFTHHSVLGAGRIAKKTDLIKWGLFKYFVNHHLTCEVYNSEFTRDFWISKGLRAPHQRLIYNGTIFSSPLKDLSCPAEIKKLIDNKFVIGTSSNLIGCKRVDLLIKSFSEFSKDKEDVILMIVGDGIEFNSLRKLTEELGLTDKVIFTGLQTDVTRFQNAMDICVFPSTTETFGLAALECMFLGKPTLCMSDGGGICEVVGDKDNIVFGINGLKNRMEYFYRLSPHQYEAASEKAHSRSLEFDMNVKAVQYLELYKDLCCPQ